MKAYRLELWATGTNRQRIMWWYFITEKEAIDFKDRLCIAIDRNNTLDLVFRLESDNSAFARQWLLAKEVISEIIEEKKMLGCWLVSIGIKDNGLI